MSQVVKIFEENDMKLSHCKNKFTGGVLLEVWGVSVVTTILHTFLSAPACTYMVYSKELKRDVTTTVMAKAILRLKTLAFIPS